MSKIFKNDIFNPAEQSDILLPEFLDYFPGYVFWKNRESKYLGCNLNLAKIVSLNKPEDIIGKYDKDLPWSKWQSKEFVDSDQKVLSTGKKHVSVHKLPIKREDGNFIYIKTEKAPIRNKNGDIQGVLGISIDITDEKLLEQKLTKQKQENIIANMPGYIYWKNSNSEYLGCNNNLAKVSGLNDRSEIIGKTDYDFDWGEEQASKFIKDDQEVMHDKVTKVSDHIMPIRRPDGNYYYVRTEKMPLYEGGKVIGVLAVAVDITELKNTQERLKKAEGRLDGMTLLSLTIAHELRTPLGSIKMTALALKQYLPILIDSYKNHTSTEENHLSNEQLSGISEAFDRIVKSATSANQIISMILTNLMAEEAQVSKYNLCSIEECLKISIEEYTFPLGDPTQIDLSQLKDFTFYGDKDLIKHVFFNLFKNAFYFIKKAGKGHITISNDQKGKYNKIYFKDTGYGIQKGNLSKIFDKFYTSDTHHGTGIGLAFCKLVMQAIGGNISCKSVFGEYTEFILSFPKVKNKKGQLFLTTSVSLNGFDTK